jgi:hypothetical protein
MRNFKNKIVKKLAALTLAVAGLGFAAVPTFAQDAAPYQNQTAPDYQPRSAEELQQLAGPVALYPDALLAQVFVAATYPDDVVAAAQYLQNGGDPNAVDSYNWDASVKGLLQTPDALNQLADDADFMNQLGDAFLNQQNDLMGAVQSLRAQAQNTGNLCTTEQQQVVTSDGCIQIIPANPQLIYVPVYDPQIVYVRRAFSCITFCPPVRVGLWLCQDFDWYSRRVYCASWGFERPWWNCRTVGFDYRRYHPGIYANARLDIRTRSTAWVRGSFKSRPVHLRGPVVSHVHVNRVDFRAHNLPTRAPRATNLANRTTTTHVNRTTVVNRNTNVVNHSSAVTKRVVNHTNGVVNHTNSTHTFTPAKRVASTHVASRSVSTSHTATPARVTNRPATSHVAASHAPASSNRPRQVASASTSHRAPASTHHR